MKRIATPHDIEKMNELNRKLRKQFGQRWQDQPRVTLSLEHGIVEPTDSKAFSLSEPEGAA